MPRAALTDRYIQGIKSTDHSTHFDLYLPNFGIRCGKYAKTFVILKGNERKRIKIGRYGAISLREARDKARQLLSAETMPDTPLFSQVLQEYVQNHLNPNTKPSSAKE